MWKGAHKVPNDGFIENESLVEIIAAQIHNINRGKAHEQAKGDAENLSLLIKQLDSILADPSYKMYENIDGLKNGVFLRREEVKHKIDKMIEKIEEYKVKFDNFFLDPEYENRSSQLLEMKKSIQPFLEECRNQLNEINLDDDTWKSISEKASSENTKLANDLENFEKWLVLNGWDDLEKDAAKFKKMEIYFDIPSKRLTLKMIGK